MENMIEAMERHIVRIAIEKEADVKGSGTIFVGDSNQKAYIITAAHVIPAKEHRLLPHHTAMFPCYTSNECKPKFHILILSGDSPE